MLQTDEKKLRWMGIDLHALWRRRAAVLITYVVLTSVLGGTVGEAGWSGHPYLRLATMCALTYALLALSVFRIGGLVKSFENYQIGVAPKHVILGSLDDWARYKYGVAGFEAASAGQQEELLKSYRVGNYLLPAKPGYDSRLDERERAERDSTSRWALRYVSYFLALMTGSTAIQRFAWSPFEVAAMLWTFFVLTITLPQARVLWTEPDPRDAGGSQLAGTEA